VVEEFGRLLAGEVGRLDFGAASTRSVLALVYLSIFGSLVGLSAYVYLLREVAVSKVATYAYVNPIVALLLGAALAGEELSPRTMIAAAIILGSVVLITSQRTPRADSPLCELPAGDLAAAPPRPRRAARILGLLRRGARGVLPGTSRRASG